jgi:hypothetical protein
MPPFTVQYLCPRQGMFWQSPSRGTAFADFYAACRFADAMKPGAGLSRVLDRGGRRVYPKQLPQALNFFGTLLRVPA